MVLEPGDFANMTQVAAAVRRVRAHLVREGHLKIEAKVERKLRREKEKPLVDLTITVIPGGVNMFGNLLIDGLDILNEPQVRKMWGLGKGRPYSGELCRTVSKPDARRKSLREFGVHQNEPRRYMNRRTW